MTISLEEVRRRILIALFSDDDLMDALVLKGGNALALVHKVGGRASLDLDFSIKTAFADLDSTSARIFLTLKREFSSIGLVVFDEKFEIKPSRPSLDQPEWWGGYTVEFKLVGRTVYDEFHSDMQALRRRSEQLGPLQRRTFTIDISQGEFCEGKLQREIDDYIVYVYSLEMIAAEKLRAICQQMSEYPFARTRKPRARDFYDIYEIVAKQGIDLTTKDNQAVLAAIFSAKQVPLNLLGRIASYKRFHEGDWPSVEASISGERKGFDSYFDFVVELANRLDALGVK